MIAFVGPGIGHFTDRSPREAVYSILSSPDVEIFFTGFDCQLGRKRLRPNICFPKCFPSLNSLPLRVTLVMQQRNINKDFRFLFRDIYIVPFLDPALGYLAV